MTRIPKIHWRWYKTFLEIWKLNQDDGNIYSGVNNDDPDIIQIAEAENGHLQVWKFINEEKYFWSAKVNQNNKWGIAKTKQKAATDAAYEYKKMCNSFKGK